jgi:hypothetical protein
MGTTMGFLNRLLGKKESAPKDDGIYFYVRCANCERVLHTRLDPQRDLQATDEGGFEVRKEMTDDRCFRRIVLEASFDSKRNVVNAEVQGGKLIDRDTWEAEKNLPRRPEPEPDPAQDL